MRAGLAVFQGPGVLICVRDGVAKAVGIRRSGPTSVFPLCLGRQPVSVGGRQATSASFALCYCGTISQRIEISDPFDRTVRVAQEAARVYSRDRFVFSLG